MIKETSEIIDRLDKLIRLVAVGILAGKSQNEQIDLLSKSGFQPREIADLLGTTANTVRVALSTLRKKTRKKKSR